MSSKLKSRLYSIPVSLFSLAIVLWIWHADSGLTSPGTISAVHLQDARLHGQDGCVACHGDGPEQMSASCLDCHAPIAQQIATTTGLHGLLPDGEVDRCAACHSEHHGEEFQLVNAQSFDRAGIDDVRAFNHAGLNFHLRGKHIDTACEKCHVNASAEVLEPGQTRFLGLSNTCTHCHQDVHQGTFGNDCASCHGQHESFRQVAEFQHPNSFPLVGAHAISKCDTCHPADTNLSVFALLTTSTVSTAESSSVRRCAECHSSPHRPSFLAAAAQTFKISESESCRLCHPSEHAGFVASLADSNSEWHAITGFPLDAPHDRLTCQKCHEGFGSAKSNGSKFAVSYPGRRADDCAACHGDPHQGAFDHGPFRGKSCLHCHRRDTFQNHTLTAQRHHETGFALSAAHQKARCEACHPREAISHNASGQSVRLLHFEKTPTDCRGCHRDPHLGQFTVGLFQEQDCTACHSEHSFHPTTFNIDAHAQTNFPLTGAHEAVACAKCHQQFYVDEKLPGQTQHARAFHGTPSKCVECHSDVHDGKFDRSGLVTHVNGRTDCARCHHTHDFKNVSPQVFDHAYWTGYELTGPHAKAKCSSCHATSRLPDEFGRTFAKAKGTNCQSCHQDPHLGQFGAIERVDCTRCHSESAGFRKTHFDHQTDSQFKLDRNHMGLACSKCHRTYPLANGREVVRYKPLGTKCSDCHAVPTRKSR